MTHYEPLQGGNSPDDPRTYATPVKRPFNEVGITRRRGMPGFPMDVPQEEPDTQHWLLQKRSLLWMWIGGITLLALTVLAELVFPIEPHFGFDDFVGFPAVYGFSVCVLMVLFSKLLGFAIKRKEDYYRD